MDRKIGKWQNNEQLAMSNEQLGFMSCLMAGQIILDNASIVFSGCLKAKSKH
ncbi:MAG: hypothetical protein J6U05_05400 [Neisseriaceae bacterium]|nr:hypothetical protein [Neisseriaceae bacterium]